MFLRPFPSCKILTNSTKLPRVYKCFEAVFELDKIGRFSAVFGFVSQLLRWLNLLQFAPLLGFELLRGSVDSKFFLVLRKRQ